MDFKKASFRNTFAVALVLSIALAFFYNNTVYTPKKKKLSKLKNELKTAQAELDALKARAMNLDKVKAELDSLMRIWNLLKKYLPTEQDLSEWLRATADAGKRSGVDFLMFKPLPAESHELYTEYPAEMRVRAGYHELATFLSFLVNLPRLTKVKKLSLSSFKNPKVPTQTIEANFVASTFIYTVPPAPSVSEDSTATKGGEKQEGKK